MFPIKNGDFLSSDYQDLFAFRNSLGIAFSTHVYLITEEFLTIRMNLAVGQS